jgi:hypothetical protein
VHDKVNPALSERIAFQWSVSMSSQKVSKININRAPVLTLWATVVAERLGYDHATALTLGKSVAGLNAQAKGQRLGIYEAPSESEQEPAKKAKARPGETPGVMVLGRSVPTVQTKEGIRATVKGQPIAPEGVERYLRQRFGEALEEVRAAMDTLAQAYPPERLARQAYALYERFRPEIPEGTKGWGAKGELKLGTIRALAKKSK